MLKKNILNNRVITKLVFCGALLIAQGCKIKANNTDALNRVIASETETAAITIPDQVYLVGVPVNVTPAKNNGSIKNCVISPALPEGLSLDATTCGITGTPVLAQAAVNYTLTVSGPSQDVLVKFNIVVTAGSPSLAAAVTSFTFAQGQNIGLSGGPIVFTNSGNAITSCSSVPALPTGLSLNATTCEITGTPTAVSSATQYNIIASNVSGTSIVSITIVVEVAPPAIGSANNFHYGTPSLSSTAAYTQSVNMSSNISSSTAFTNYGGVITSCTSSTSLPSGLSLGASTCTLSGTPTSNITQSLTVTAAGSTGYSIFVIDLSVAAPAAPSNLLYAIEPAIFTRLAAGTPDAPTVSGVVTSYSSTALPTGLVINSSTGVLSGTPTIVSAGVMQVYTVTVTATGPGGTTTHALVIDINDVAPSLFSYASANVTYTKQTTIPSNTPSVTGTVVAYSVSPALPTGLTLGSVSGILSGTPTAFTSSSPVVYTVTATNSGGSLTTSITMTLFDQAPSSLVYASQTVTYTKNSAIAPDSPSNAGGAMTSYSVTSLPAGLGLTAGGVLTGTPSVATNAAANYTITGLNSGGSAQAVLSIRVNDIAPTAISYGSMNYTVGTAIAHHTPSVTGGTPTSYTASGLPTGLAIDSSTGVMSGTPTVQLPQAVYTVTGTNPSGSAQGLVTITVNDVVPTGFSYASANVTYTKNSTIGNNTPSVTGLHVSYTATSLPVGLSLDATSGVIAGTPTVFSSTPSVYTVTASNTGGSITAAVTMTVNDIAPVINSYQVQSATYTVGSLITNNSPSLSGGAPVSFSVSSLPVGLGITSAGVITGTPSVFVSTVSVNYTVTAINSGGSGSYTISIIVNDAAPGFSGYLVPLPVYTVGTQITNNTPVLGGGGAPTAYSITPSLPAGLALTAAGVITGTPSVVTAATAYSVTAFSSGGGSQSVSLTITVNDKAPANFTYTAASVTYTQGLPIVANSPVFAGGGGAVISYSVSSGLPAGMLFSTTTGVLSGGTVITQGSTVFTVTATNTGGQSTSNITMTVAALPSPAFYYQTPAPVYTVGSAITSNQIVMVVGGFSGCTMTAFSVSSALPAGLSIYTTTGSTMTGSLTGTPSVVSASQNYTIGASIDCTAGGLTVVSRVLNLTVNDIAPKAFTYTVPNATYTKNSAITANTITLAPAGGTATSYSISSNFTATTGLTFNTTTAAITGTPTPSSYGTPVVYTVTASNSSGIPVIQTVTITLDDMAPQTFSYTSSTITYTKNSAITALTPQFYGAAGGTATSYSITSGYTATGLSFNTTTGVLSGTATTFTASLTPYTVTASNTGGSKSFTISINVVDVAPQNFVYSNGPVTYTRTMTITPNTPILSGGGTGIATSYSISTLPAGLSINNTTGAITGAPSVFTGSFTPYTVTAYNSGGSTSYTLSIDVVDLAPSAFTYSNSTVTYTKNTTITANTPIVSGGVLGAAVSYSISSLPAGLVINNTTGAITGSPSVFTAALTPYTVTAYNTGGSTSFAVTIDVVDLAPQAFTYTPQVFTVTRGTTMASNTPVSSGPGGTATSYSISANFTATTLTFNTSTGAISGTATTFTGGTAVPYTVTALDSGGATTYIVSVAVVDQPPQTFTYTSNPVTYTKSVAIGTPNAVILTGAVTGAATSYSTTSLPAGLGVVSATGAITGTPGALSGLTSYTVTAYDSGGSTDSVIGISVIDLSPQAFSYTPSSFTITKGTAMSTMTLTASGVGGTSLGYSISPSLPTGLSWSSTGQISGTATTFTGALTPYVVTAYNTGGITNYTLNMNVLDAAVASVTYSPNPVAYTNGVTITPNTPATTGGTATSYSISTNFSVTGLSFGATTGVISGVLAVPAVSSNFTATTFTVTAHDSAGSPVSTTLTVTLVDAHIQNLSYTIPALVKGTAMTSAGPSSTGGTPVSYTYSGSLPGGLAFSTATGVFTGTPSVTMTSVLTVTASNSNPTPAAYTFTMTVNDTLPVLSAFSSYTYTTGTAYTLTITNTAASSATVFSVSPAFGILGMAQSAAGNVLSFTGTPGEYSVTTAFVYTISASNSGGSVSGNLTITVKDIPPTISYTPASVTFTTAATITPMTPALTGCGVVNECSFTVSSGSLPAGLTVDVATGVITGSPSSYSVTPYSVTVSVTNGSSTGASPTISMRINQQAPLVTCPSVSTTVTAGYTTTSTITSSYVSTYTVTTYAVSGTTVGTTTTAAAAAAIGASFSGGVFTLAGKSISFSPSVFTATAVIGFTGYNATGQSSAGCTWTGTVSAPNWSSAGSCDGFDCWADTTYTPQFGP